MNNFNPAFTNGEIAVDEYLKKNGYIYVKNRSLGTLFSQVDSEVKQKRPDFVVLKGKEKLPFAIIEFDGAQHFSSSHWYNKRKNIYLSSIMADDLKTKFCEKRKIPLLRIRYDQIGKVDRILDRFFKAPEKFIYTHNPYLSNVKYYADREIA